MVRMLIAIDTDNGTNIYTSGGTSSAKFYEDLKKIIRTKEVSFIHTQNSALICDFIKSLTLNFPEEFD